MESQYLCIYIYIYSFLWYIGCIDIHSYRGYIGCALPTMTHRIGLACDWAPQHLCSCAVSMYLYIIYISIYIYINICNIIYIYIVIWYDMHGSDLLVNYCSVCVCVKNIFAWHHGQRSIDISSGGIRRFGFGNCLHIVVLTFRCWAWLPNAPYPPCSSIVGAVADGLPEMVMLG